MRRYVTLDVDRNTKIVDITVFNEDKDLAAKIANTIAKDYRDYRLGMHSSQMASGIEKLNETYATEEEKIQLMQSNVDQLRDQLGIHDSDPNSQQPTPTINSEQLQQFNEKLMDQKALFIKQQNEFLEFQTVQATNPTALADVLLTINPDAELSDLLGKLHDNEQKFVTETNVLGMGNPQITATWSLISTLKDQIAGRVNGIMIGLEAQVKAMGDEVDALNAEVTNAETVNQNDAVRGQPYWKLKLDLQDKRELHKFLAEKIESEQADAVIPKSALVTTINPAMPGEAPVRPTKTLNIALGAFFWPCLLE